MAHSFIIGRGSAFEVRDSSCEIVLELLRDRLAALGTNPEALEWAARWFDYWYSAPPGTKELLFECPAGEVREAISEALVSLIPALNPEGEPLRLVKQMEALLTEG